jgi:succinyl-CoA synthetase beta subunit
MKIYEYQAKEILSKFDIQTPRGKKAKNPNTAKKIAEKLGGKVVVKAQVHAGGRGKAGGVKLAGTPEEAFEFAKQILGMRIGGLKVKQVLVEEALDIAHEYYLSFALDRSAKRVIGMASAQGGVDIEEVASHSPEKIFKFHVDPAFGLFSFQLRNMAHALHLEGEKVKAFKDLAEKLYKTFVSCDCTLAEINPLVFTKSGAFVAADAKMDIDENALFRHPDFEALREASEEDPLEIEAHKKRIPYVRLDGDIGILGNGAGLVMTTLDMVSREGGKPANFLDVGGGSNWEVVKNSLELVLKDKKVKGVFINIFGGISRCDEVARGILEADKHLNIQVPMVIRLSGTNEEEGRALLAQSRFVSAETMEEGAKKIVELVHEKS